MLRILFSPPMICYVLAIVLLNIGFSYVPMIDMGFGMFSPMALVAGLVFVLRDFAQRRSGHFVLIAMAVGAVLSYLMADPYVALASVMAFMISEFADWGMYTLTKKPFSDRVLISSIVSTPVDTLVFLLFINNLSTGTFLLMILSKLVAAVGVWAYYQNRDERQFYSY